MRVNDPTPHTGTGLRHKMPGEGRKFVWSTCTIIFLCSKITVGLSDGTVDEFWQNFDQEIFSSFI